MKKVVLLILFAMFVLPCDAKTKIESAETGIPKVFIYHISDDNFILPPNDETVKTISTDNQNQINIPENKDITTDDVTADTSGENIIEENNEIIAEDIPEPEIEDYQIDDMYSDVLHGYAEYNEDGEDVIALSEYLDNPQTIKLSKPGKVGSKKYNSTIQTSPSLYSSLSTVEYSIAPISGKSYAKKGGFSAGTTYSQGIDYAELEQSTGVFSRYETKYFAISTAYAKTVNSTNNNYNDNFYIAPELIINQYFSLKEILSTDITKNRKKAEMVLSINPFGKKDTDRLRLEFGASSTYDDTNALLKNQFKFSTKFQL